MCEDIVMPHGRGLSFEEFNAIFKCIQNPVTKENLVWNAQHLPPKDSLDEREFWTVINRFDKFDLLVPGIETEETVGETFVHYVRCSVKWGGKKEDHPVHLYWDHGDFDPLNYVIIGDTWYEKAYFQYLKHLRYLSMRKGSLLRCRRRPARSLVMVLEEMPPGLDALREHHRKMGIVLSQERLTKCQIDELLS
jgi:hypothetical protein